MKREILNKDPKKLEVSHAYQDRRNVQAKKEKEEHNQMDSRIITRAYMAEMGWVHEAKRKR